jgi:hypothetical protein
MAALTINATQTIAIPSPANTATQIKKKRNFYFISHQNQKSLLYKSTKINLLLD